MRKGEKASAVVKYGTIERENGQGEDKKIPYTKAYRVFNTDQFDGLPEVFYCQPDGARLVEDHETPDFFDVVVGATALTSGDILTLFEFEDQNRSDANASLAGLTVLFPKAPIDWHLGKEAPCPPPSKFI